MLGRIQKVNELIKTIAQEDRAFFKNKEGNGLIANFKLKDKKLCYQDEWKGHCRRINSKMLPKDIIDWVSHGHTIRSQVLEFTDFIEKGEPKKGMLSRYWGISIESQIKIHKKAHELGYLDGDRGFSFHDYTEKKDRYVCDECGEREAFSKCEKGMYLCPACEGTHARYTGHRVEGLNG